MSTPSYIKENLEELVSNAPDEVLAILEGDDISSTTMTISNNYGIPVKLQVALSNVITYILIGALLPEDVVNALIDLVEVDEDTAIKIATDLEGSILQKVRGVLLKKEDIEIKTLEHQGEKTKEELREAILDTTKRESAITKPQSSSANKKTTIIAPGSRSQLLEQLQVIGSIPDDEEISERLKHIQEQISSIKKQEEDNTLHSKIALKSFMFGEKGAEPVIPTSKTATYSVAPKQYNIDPYREMPEE